MTKPKKVSLAKRAAEEVAACSQQSVKRSKSEIPGQALINLHYDYLESIFQWLNLKDLLTMAQVNTRFHQHIHSFIARKYAKDWIEISLDLYDWEVDTNVFQLREMKLIIPFLRYFGHSISNLIVRFDAMGSSQSLAIEKSILKYCNGLKQLNLLLCRKGAFDSIKKPFKQLEVLNFTECHLGLISQFNKWFPKLRHLAIKCPIVADKTCIEVRLPLLEHLDVKSGSKYDEFCRGNIYESIRLNPQLRSIRVNNGTNIEDFSA